MNQTEAGLRARLVTENAVIRLAVHHTTAGFEMVLGIVINFLSGRKQSEVCVLTKKQVKVLIDELERIYHEL